MREASTLLPFNSLTVATSQASSWSSKRHEVFGSVVDASGNVLHNLFGRWTEALYCGHAPSARVVWRPGSMPDNSGLYYGFTRFAIELNELLEEHKRLLPPTDTRFRPDQRFVCTRFIAISLCLSGSFISPLRTIA